jgi:hypothetical protein
MKSIDAESLLSEFTQARDHSNCPVPFLYCLICMFVHTLDLDSSCRSSDSCGMM